MTKEFKQGFMDMMRKIAAGTPVRRSRGHRRFFNDTTRAVQPYDVGRMLVTSGVKGRSGDLAAEAAASGVDMKALGEDFIAKNPDLSFAYARSPVTGEVNVIGKAPWWSDVGSRVGTYIRSRQPKPDRLAWARGVKSQTAPAPATTISVADDSSTKSEDTPPS